MLAAVHQDALSGKTLKRPGLVTALQAAESGAASAIVVAKLDRLSRSLADFASLMARAQAGHWNVVALDLGIDLSTPSGEFMANVLASAAQWERRIIGQRTKDALAVKRAEGIRLGRPVTLPAEVVESILEARSAGAGWSHIARDLNERNVATAHGGAKWYPSTVQAVVRSAEAAA
jgi:DNA invertase Pin-like site-specific DNA recombinase